MWNNNEKKKKKIKWNNEFISFTGTLTKQNQNGNVRIDI